MKKVFKWIALILGVLVGLIVLAVLVGYVLGGIRLGRTFSVTPETIKVAADAPTLERGKHWYAVLCNECHGEDLGGKVIFDDPALGTFNGANLTTGEGGASAEMSDAELATALRHGVDHDGRGLVAMPSEAFYHLSDEDLASIIAYMRHAPPVDQEWGEPRLGFIGRALVGLGIFGNVMAAEYMDHDAVRAPAPAPAVSVEYGAYLVRVSGCASCHAAELNGGKSPDPAAPPAPNLTPGGHLAEWSESDFVTAMRTGVEPDGEEMDPKFMPWEDLGHMSDHELSAVWLHLQSLSPLESAVEEDE